MKGSETKGISSALPLPFGSFSLKALSTTYHSSIVVGRLEAELVEPVLAQHGTGVGPRPGVEADLGKHVDAAVVEGDLLEQLAVLQEKLLEVRRELLDVPVERQHQAVVHDLLDAAGHVEVSIPDHILHFAGGEHEVHLLLGIGVGLLAPLDGDVGPLLQLLEDLHVGVALHLRDDVELRHGEVADRDFFLADGEHELLGRRSGQLHCGLGRCGRLAGRGGLRSLLAAFGKDVQRHREQRKAQHQAARITERLHTLCPPPNP